MAVNEVVVLSDKDILRAAIKERGTNQRMLADQLGITQATLSQNISRDRMGLDNFKKILDAIDYDVYVVDRRNKKAMWCVDIDE